jgi:hypothetical protein
MGFFIFIVAIFIFFVGGGWLLGKLFGNFLFPKENEDKFIFIDKSVHHHHHEHKTITVIDDVTKKKVFELKESKDEKK